MNESRHDQYTKTKSVKVPSDLKLIKGSLEQPHGMNCLHPSLSNLRSGILCKVYNVYLA